MKENVSGVEQTFGWQDCPGCYGLDLETVEAGNKEMSFYRAPWSKVVVGTSIVVSILCIGTGVMGVMTLGNHGKLWWTEFLPPLILAWSAFYTVRGYEIGEEEIRVRRLCWCTRLPRTGLVKAEYRPGVMKGSIRTCGNAGMFGITGWYRNAELGNYRALVTDLERTVVLHYADRRFVISPEDPERFVADLHQG